MMKKVFIHIGPHKTGTTTIQDGLFINSDVLREARICLPETGRTSPRNAAQHKLASELLKSEVHLESLGVWGDLLKEIQNSNAENIIISSEEFSKLDEGRIQFIKSILLDFDVKIVTYLRRQDLIIQSIWSEVMKRGSSMEAPPDFPEWVHKSNWTFLNLDYYQFLNKWASIFNNGNLLVRILEKGQMKGNLFQDFLSTCGIRDAGHYKIPGDSNLSPGIKTLVLIRELKNRLHGKLDNDESQYFYSIIRDYGEKAGWNQQKINLINSDIHTEIFEHYMSSNRQVAREYFQRDDLFKERFVEKEVTDLSLSNLSQNELLDMSAHVFDVLISTGKRGDLEMEAELRALSNHITEIYATRGWKTLEFLRRVRKSVKRFIDK